MTEPGRKFRVNKDGSVTFLDEPANPGRGGGRGPRPTRNSGGGGGGGGLMWLILIVAAAAGAFFAGKSCSDESYSPGETELEDSVEVVEVVEDWAQDSAVVEDPASHDPEVTIIDISQEHNVYHDGKKGMEISVDFDVAHWSSTDVCVKVYFYHEDNITVLHDPYDNPLVIEKHAYLPSSYDESYRGFTLFMPYDDLNFERPVDIDLSFDVSVGHGDNVIARKNDSQFHFNIP